MEIYSNFNLFNRSFKHVKLKKKLMKIIEDGFVMKDNCLFSINLLKYNIHVSKSDFFDDIAYECFINSIFIDSYVKKDIEFQAFAFIKALMQAAINQNLNIVITCSQDDFSYKVQWHLQRIGEFLVDHKELDKFDQNVIVLFSSKAELSNTSY